MAKGKWPWSQSNGIRQAETPAQIIERLSMPEPNTGCSMWLGELNSWGYPLIFYKVAPKKAVTRRAQIVVYELAHGPVPEGLEVSHLCGNEWCVNPDHLLAETHSENMLRARHPLRKFCKNGHLMAETRKNGACSICHAELKRAANARRTASGYWKTEEYKADKREKDRARYAANREAMAARKRAERQRRNLKEN